MTNSDEELKKSEGTAVVEDVKTEEKKKGGFIFSLYDLLEVLISSFAIILVMFTFLFRVVGVNGHSMESTLSHNDWVLTYQKQAYEYGDIVVITQPNYFEKPLIKRVIATSGQTVDIDFYTSTVYVDGKALYEPYIKDSYINPKLDDIDFPYTVPEGCLFCMGDNRNGSTDSRSTLIGPIEERYILGKAFIRILPFGQFNIYEAEGEVIEESDGAWQ